MKHEEKLRWLEKRIELMEGPRLAPEEREKMFSHIETVKAIIADLKYLQSLEKWLNKEAPTVYRRIRELIKSNEFDIYIHKKGKSTSGKTKKRAVDYRIKGKGSTKK